VKLMKFKLLQDPSLARALSKTLGGELAMFSHVHMLLKFCEIKIFEPQSVQCYGDVSGQADN
jgi:hypothetical protein